MSSIIAFPYNDTEMVYRTSLRKTQLFWFITGL